MPLLPITQFAPPLTPPDLQALIVTIMAAATG